MDNGSTDNSGSICDSFSQKDSRITVIHKPHGSISSGRNAGLEVADGDYIAFVDSDDLITEDMIQTLLDAIIANKADIAICKAQRMYQDLIEQIDETGVVKQFTSEEALFSWLCQKMFGAEVWGKLYKKDCVAEIRFPEKRCEDMCYLFAALRKASKIVVIDKRKYLYRMHRLYKDRSAYRRPVEDEKVAVYEDILQIVKVEYPDIYTEMFKSASDSILNSVMRIYAAKKVEKQKVYLDNAHRFFAERYKEIQDNNKIGKKDKQRIKVFVKHKFIFKMAFVIRNIIKR